MKVRYINMDERLEKIRISSKVGSSIWETIDDGWYLCKASYIDRLINNGTVEINNTDESDQYKAKIEELQNRVSELEQMLSGVDTFEYALEKYGEQIIENYSEHKRLEACKNNLSKANQVKASYKRASQAQILQQIILGRTNRAIADNLGISEKTVYNNIKSLDYFECDNILTNYKDVFASVPERNIKLFKSKHYNIKKYRSDFKTYITMADESKEVEEPVPEVTKDNSSVSGVVIPAEEPVKIPEPMEPPKIEEPKQVGVTIDDVLNIQKEVEAELAREQEIKERNERLHNSSINHGFYLDYMKDKLAYLKKHNMLPYDEDYNFKQPEPLYEEMEY